MAWVWSLLFTIVHAEQLAPFYICNLASKSRVANNHINYQLRIVKEIEIERALGWAVSKMDIEF